MNEAFVIGVAIVVAGVIVAYPIQCLAYATKGVAKMLRAALAGKGSEDE